MIKQDRYGGARRKFARWRLRREIGKRFAASAALAYAVMPSAAFAASGETADSVGTYRTTSAVCQQLRAKSGVPTGAFTFACNADRSTAGGREACDIVSLSSTLVRGSALGFCADVLPSVRAVKFPDTGPPPTLEAAKTLRATSFGVNTGITRSAGNTVDVICSTFAPASGTVGKNAAQGVRACRQVLSCAGGNCPAPPPACNDGPAGEYIKTVRDDTACAAVQAQLAATITGNQTPPISHALFFSATQNVGKPGSQALFVCSGYTWACGDPGSADASGGSKVDYQIDFGVLETPGCGLIRGIYRCW
jgi:hypothetical protein